MAATPKKVYAWRMTVDLPREAEQFVKQLLATGDYADERAVVAEALARWQQQKAMEATVRAEVQRGLDDLDAGRYRTIRTPEEAKAFGDEIKRRARELKAEREQHAQ